MSTRGRIERAARKLQTYPAADRDHDAPARLLAAAQEVGATVIEGDWTAVRRASLDSLGLGLAAHGAIRRAMPDRVSRTPLVSAQGLIAALRGIARAPNRAELVAGLRSHAESVGPEAVERLAPSLLRLAEGRIAGVPLLTELGRREPLVLPYPEDETLAALTRGLLGLIHVEFNLALRHWRDKGDALLEDDWNIVLQIELDEFRRHLRAREAGLQGALMSAPEAEATEAAALALFDQVQLHAPRFARVQAATARLAELLRDKGRGADAEVIGARAAEAHEHIREAVAAGVGAMHVALELCRARALRIASAFADLPLVAQAATSSFDVALPDGKDTELSKLSDAEPDAFVDIGGFVEAIAIERPSPGKLSSTLLLRDPSSGAAAEAAAIFSDLRHIGVTKGSYCRLSGHFKPSLDLLGGKPGVQIDRLEIATLARTSWRMALLKASERWFEPYRNGHNMRWSLGAHDAAPEDVPDSVTAGAAELIYLEAIRP